VSESDHQVDTPWGKGKGEPGALSLPSRPRRNRRLAALRGLIRETRLHPAQLVYPLFVHEADTDEPIDSMPGCVRWSERGFDRGLRAHLEQAAELGVRSVILFPKIPADHKTPGADSAWDAKGLIPRVVRKLKASLPELAVMTDVALDPYNADGHDGLVAASGEIENDRSVSALVKQALCHAEAGADVVAPSDMMDGRVGAIRAALDAAGHMHVGILSYTAKYASALYGPFRGALDSAPRAREHVPSDKSTYQMDPANATEAIRELRLDEAEGADMVMVKPAGAYLDVIRRVRDATTLPVAAYQVSGEYLMIKAASASGWLDERAAALETLTAIRRAGADIILTYYAVQAARWLRP